VAVGPSGRVYVADQFSHLVQMFSPAGVFEGQWGSGGGGSREFGAVGGLAIDPRGDVYVVDSTHDRVEKHDAGGRFIASWGSSGRGVGQFDFGAGIGPDMPPGGGIAVGSSYVYVSDSRNNRIERFALNGTGAKVVATAGGGPGKVRGPQGLALARTGETGKGPGGQRRQGASAAAETLYVADDGNDRVQELTGDGRFIAEARVFDATPSTFQNPWGVAVHGGSVYVVDDNHGRIVRFDRRLQFAGAFTGSGPYRLTDFLRAAATDAAGHVYVADSSADRVEVFTPTGTPLRGWGSSGIAPGQFVAPVDVASGPGGRLLVAEAFREIVPLYPTGAPFAYRAEIRYGSPWSSGGGVTLGSRFFSPTGLAFAPDGTVWVTDRNNDVLRHLSASGHFLDAVGGAVGAQPATRKSDQLTEPHGVAVDRSGAVVVADTGADRIKRLAPDGGLLAAWSSPSGGLPGGRGSEAGARRFQRPRAVAAGPAGRSYVADTGNDRVEELDSGGRLVASWGGPGSALGRFESPDGLAVDPAGDVYVADGVLDRVQEFTAGGKLLAAWGRAGTGPGELREPIGMSVDCRGNLLVADAGNNRVTIFANVAPGASCKR
jgi:sugar lactone lactonase YvrE